MAKIDDLKAQAALIENETAVGGNTAQRVGGAIGTAAELIDGTLQDVGVLKQNAMDYDCGLKKTLADAINAVPENLRKGGLTIHFHTTDNGEELSYTLISSLWSIDENNWVCLSQSLLDIVIGGGNIFTKNRCVYDNSNGQFKSYAYGNCTPLIPLALFVDYQNQEIVIKAGTFRGSSLGVAFFFDKDKKYLGYDSSTITYSNKTPYPSSNIPSNTVYIAFNQYKNSDSVIIENLGFVGIGGKIDKVAQITDANSEELNKASAEIIRINKSVYGLVQEKTTNFPKDRYYNFEFSDVKAGEYYLYSKNGSGITANIRKNVKGTVSTILKDVDMSNPCYLTINEDVDFLYIFIPANQTSSLSGTISFGLYQDALVKPFEVIDETAEIVNFMMSKDEFVSAINNKFAEIAKASIYSDICFYSLRSYDITWAQICDAINHNLRENVCTPSMQYKELCESVNKAFANFNLRRFSDAKLDVTKCNASLNTNLQADEPSAIVSEDGSTLYLYAHLKRIESKDGVNWSSYIPTPLSGGVSYLMHNNVNLIDGIYYLIGCEQNIGGGLYLFTSVDGVNFTQKGKLFEAGVELSVGHPVVSWGNTYLIKEYGSDKFYLYIEAQSDKQSWVIHLVTYTNFDKENEDGTIGDAVINNSNPILVRPLHGTGVLSEGAVQSAGNPDFAKSMDNRPLKVGGKYYIYFHMTWKGIANIVRAHSTDLKNWTSEGIIADNRDVPTGGNATSGNADQCIIEFKGRTYLFYTWDINNPNLKPYIKYTVDDRPLRDILKIKP